ncbi:unnamed protein product [Hydatigera taeniaeformis]|uniref:AGC-kinase C-terminal domain-containing protein n=1 Tax=Hydatigena taeniaeformis TaxID=6205 RepID=A0A0R3WSH6_HYDTA|nr:unnamed protein product [Hydatigera taeniaeformis]
MTSKELNLHYLLPSDQKATESFKQTTYFDVVAPTRHLKDAASTRHPEDSRSVVIGYEHSPPPPPPRQPQVRGLSTPRMSNLEVDEPLVYPPNLGYFGNQNDFRVQKFSC